MKGTVEVKSWSRGRELTFYYFVNLGYYWVEKSFSVLWVPVICLLMLGLTFLISMDTNNGIPLPISSQRITKAHPLQLWKKTQLICQYTCKHEDCELQNNCYIGQTNTTLSRRLTIRLAIGGPKQHHQEVHHATLTRKELVDNTKNHPNRTWHISFIHIGIPTNQKS